MDIETMRAIRHWKGMTQEQFSRWLGVSTPTVALFEAGHRNLSEATKGKLAHKFDINDADFIEYKKRRESLRGR